MVERSNIYIYIDRGLHIYNNNVESNKYTIKIHYHAKKTLNDGLLKMLYTFINILHAATLHFRKIPQEINVNTSCRNNHKPDEHWCCNYGKCLCNCRKNIYSNLIIGEIIHPIYIYRMYHFFHIYIHITKSYNIY